MTEAGYYKESVILIWAELRQLYQVQKHTILFIQAYSPESAIEATMEILVHVRGRTENTTDAQTNTLLPGSASCLMKIPCWPTDSHTMLQLSGENLMFQIHKLVRKYCSSC